MNTPFARRAAASAARPTGSSPPRPGRRTRSRPDTNDVEQQDQQASSRPTRSRGRSSPGPEDVRRDEDLPAVDAVHVDAGDRAEKSDGRDEERQEQQADRRCSGSSSRRRRRSARRGPCCRRSGSRPATATDAGTAGCGRRRRAPGVGAVSAVPPAVVTSRIRRSGPRDPAQGGGEGRVAALDEPGEPALERRAARRARGGRRSGSGGRCRRPAGRRARCRRRTDACAADARHRRAAASGRVGPARRAGYQSRGWPSAGTRSRSVAGTSIRSTGVTVTTTSGWVAASWAMIPPDRVSEPVSLSGGADRLDLDGIRDRHGLDRHGARRARHDDARDEARRRRWRSPRRRRCGAR